MKVLLSLVSSAILVLLTFTFVSAQDIIIDKEGETISCKVVSVTNEEVIYKTPEGILKSFSKSNLLMVKYAEDIKGHLTETKSANVSETKNEAIQPTGEIAKRRGKYYLDGNRIKKKAIYKLIKNSSCEEAKSSLKKARGSNALALIGNFIVGLGAGYTIYNVIDGGEDYITGSAVALGGLTFVIIGEGLHNKRMEEAVGAYNSCVK